MTADRIYQLYKYIDDLGNKTIELDDDLDDYIKIQARAKMLSIEPFHIAHRTALTLKREHVFEKVKKLNEEISNIKNGVDRTMLDLEKIFDTIDETIEELDNSGTGHVEVKNALKEGTNAVEEIRQLHTPIKETRKVEKYCRSLLNFIQQLKDGSYIQPKDIREDLEYFRKKMHDMKKYIHKTFTHINEVEEYSVHLNQRIKNLKKAIKQIEDFKEEIAEMEDYEDNIEDANIYLQEAQKNYNVIINSVDDFEDVLNRIEDKIEESNKEQELKKVLRAAKEHADMLVKLAKDYNEEFNVTHEANLAIKASKAYQDIIDLLNEAKDITKNANQTLDRGLQKIENNEYSINELLTNYMNNSDVIINKAKKLKHLINKLDEQREILNISISDIRDTLWKTGLRQIEIDRNLYNNITMDKRNIFQIIHNAIGISSRMSEIHKNSNNIKSNIQNILLPQLAKIRKGGDEILSFGEEKCEYLFLILFILFLFLNR